MILVADTIVDKRAVMIEPLHTLIAIVTVHRIYWSQVLAIDTDIIQM